MPLKSKKSTLANFLQQMFTEFQLLGHHGCFLGLGDTAVKTISLSAWGLHCTGPLLIYGTAGVLTTHCTTSLWLVKALISKLFKDWRFAQSFPEMTWQVPGKRGWDEWNCSGHAHATTNAVVLDSFAPTHQVALEGQGGPSEIPLFFYPVLVESAQIPPDIFLFLFLKFLYLV